MYVYLPNKSKIIILVSDQARPAARAVADEQAAEDGDAHVRRLALSRLCPVAHRARLPHRGAEDCQQGDQGGGGHEQEMIAHQHNVGLLHFCGLL